MSILRKMRAVFHDDCVKLHGSYGSQKITTVFLPQMVGNYVSHKNAAYYKNSLIKVNKKADIPTGIMPAVHIFIPLSDCGYKFIKLSRLSACKEIRKNRRKLSFLKTAKWTILFIINFN